jgi:hypothetical protein
VADLLIIAFLTAITCADCWAMRFSQETALLVQKTRFSEEDDAFFGL